MIRITVCKEKYDNFKKIVYDDEVTKAKYLSINNTLKIRNINTKSDVICFKCNKIIKKTDSIKYCKCKKLIYRN